MIRYHVYWNGGTGEGIDHSTPIGDTDLLGFLTLPLAYPGDYRFAVRSYDDATGLEDLNTDYVRLVLDEFGNDVTHRPNPPSNLSARPLAFGAIRVDWSYFEAGQGGAPTEFLAWIQPWAEGVPIDYEADPDLVVPALASRPTHGGTAYNFTHHQRYRVGVRAANESGAETNLETVSVIADAVGPEPVSDLEAEATFLAPLIL